MRKLFKKSLACCLVLALSLCMFAGAISANALTTNPAYSTEDVTVAPGESTTIKFTIKDFAEIQGVILKVYVPSVVASIDAVTVDGIELVEWSDETGEGNYQVDNENKFIKFMTLANFEGVDNVAALTFDIKVTVAADAEAGEYGYTAPVIQATDGDVLVSINGEFGLFTVVENEPEVPVCEHANATFYYDDEHEFTPAEGYLSGTTSVETAKGKIWLQCPDCGEIYQEDLHYHYFYTTGTQNAQLESEIRFEFKAQPKHLNSQGNFDDAIFVIDMQKDGGKVRQVTNYADADYEDGSKPYYVLSMGVAAKEMTALMTSTVFVKYDGKWWSGYQFNMKLVEYLQSKFTGFDDFGKTLLVDMMNFGAVAQNHFGFNTADLASDYIGDYASYATTVVPAIEDKTNNPLLATPDHVGYNAYGLDLGSIIGISLTFRTDLYKGNEVFGDLSAVCTYTNNAGVAVPKTYTSAEYKPVEGKANRYTFIYDGIAAKDMRKIVTCTVENADGQVGYALETSIESVAAAMKAANPTKTTLCDTIDAMMVYGDSANAFFNR